jgi:hypothetical protein
MLLTLTAILARAGLITSMPAGDTTTVFAGGNNCAPGVDSGFTITGPACANYSGFFGFGQNGFWNNPPSGFALVGNDSLSSSILINLGGLYSNVGGFMNYAVTPGGSGSDSVPTGDPTLIALAANGTTVLGTYDLTVLDPINTPAGTNAGTFVGIQDATNDIHYLELLNDGIAMHNISLGTTSSSSAPEPGGILLLGSGLGLLVVRRLIGS